MNLYLKKYSGRWWLETTLLCVCPATAAVATYLIMSKSLLNFFSILALLMCVTLVTISIILRNRREKRKPDPDYTQLVIVGFIYLTFISINAVLHEINPVRSFFVMFLGSGLIAFIFLLFVNSFRVKLYSTWKKYRHK